MTKTMDELMELQRLVKGADSIELKLTLPEHVVPLGGDGARASIRSRPRSARCSSSTRPTSTSTGPASSCGPGGSRGASTTRSSSCARSSRTSCPAELRQLPEFVVEVDALPGGYVCSASLKGTLVDERRAQRGRRRASAAQAVLQAAAGVLRRARPRGPDHRRPVGAGADLRAQAEARDRRRSAASSSPRCGCIPTARGSSSCRRSACRAKGSSVAAEVRDFLGSKGIGLDGEQQTKTKTALEFFSAELRAQADASAPA